MTLHGIGSFIAGLYRARWVASIFLMLLLDVATWMAFAPSSGPSLIKNQDKLLHMIAFFVLYLAGHMSLSFDFLPRLKNHTLLLLFNAMIWTGYGLFIELVQKQLPHRQFSLADLMADVLGILLAMAFIILTRLYPRSTAKHG